MIRIVFHVHSQASPDCNLSLEKIIKICQKNNINVVVLTDHNSLTLSKIINKVRIISGEEIKTKNGEVIGIFMTKRIEKGLSLEQTIKQIKSQGGAVVIPHPFDRFRTRVLKKQDIIDNITNVDVIETFNARNINNIDNKEAEDFANKYNKIKIIGSDAHLSREICNTYFEMEDFNDKQDFLEKLKSAKFYTKRANIFVHLITGIVKVFKILKI